MTAETFTVNVAKVVSSVQILDGYGESSIREGVRNGRTDAGLTSGGDTPGAVAGQAGQKMRDLEGQTAEVRQLCQALNAAVAEINQFYDDILAGHKAEVAKLSVEIARRILMHNVEKGDYEIETIVKEALDHVPLRQDVTVHLNSEDLCQLQKLQREGLGDVLADIKLVEDPSVGRAECLVESPKGIVKSFIDEHIERIAEVLARVE